MEFTAEDLGVKPNSGGAGKNFKNLVPPTQELSDGTLEIIDWVKGIKLVGYAYDNNNAIFTFKDKEGATIRKWIQDPLSKAHIQRMDDANPKKKEQIGYSYFEVINLFKKFIKPFMVDAIVSELKPITLETLSENLYKLVEEEGTENTNEVWLKVGFQNAEGVAPKYVIPQKRYLGTEKYPPVWTETEKDEKWNDKKNFKFVEDMTPNFTTPPIAPIAPPAFTPPSDIDEVFGVVAPTLNTPDDVDYLN